MTKNQKEEQKMAFKNFYDLLGKIIGIALAALVVFLIWYISDLNMSSRKTALYICAVTTFYMYAVVTAAMIRFRQSFDKRSLLFLIFAISFAIAGYLTN